MIERDNVTNLRDHKERIDKDRLSPALKGGGGGGTSDDMDRRVTALEKAFEKMDTKLDKLVTDVGGIRGDLSEVKGRVSALPDARAFGEIKGKIDTMPSGEAFGRIASRVERLPTLATLSTLLGLFAVIVAAVTNARTVLGWLGITFP